MKTLLSYLFLSLLIGTGCCQAQNFNYSFLKDSTTYSELVSATTIASGQNLTDQRYGIHLPFSFNFCGSITDSVLVETNGYIQLDHAKKLAIVSYSNFSARKNASDQYVSAISYTISGSAGSRILKIQFSDFAQSVFSTADHLSYQVWLYEGSNKAEIHTGDNSSPEVPILIGLISRNMDTEDKAFLISGHPSSPVGQLITGEDSFVQLNSLPGAGVIYSFTPTF